MTDLVESILLAEAEKQASYKTTEVVKDIDVDYDEGNLLVVDPNEINVKQLRFVESRLASFIIARYHRLGFSAGNHCFYCTVGIIWPRT